MDVSRAQRSSSEISFIEITPHHSEHGIPTLVVHMEGRQMTQVHILAIEPANRSFQVCATDRGGAVLFSCVLSRTLPQRFSNEQSPCIVARGPVPPATFVQAAPRLDTRR